MMIQALALCLVLIEKSQCFSTLPSKVSLSSLPPASSTLLQLSELDGNELTKLDSCRTRTEASKILNRALYPDGERDASKSPLFASVKVPKNLSTRPISDAELALQTRTINSKYKIIDLIEQNGDRDIDRSSLAVLCVFIFGSSSAILAQQATTSLPDIFRWLLVFILCFSPLILVGYGLAVPDQLSETLVSIQREIFPSYRKRMIQVCFMFYILRTLLSLFLKKITNTYTNYHVQHEAGHFLIGYLLGWPVKSYQVRNAVKNAVEFYPLGDDDAGAERARALGFDKRKDNINEGEDIMSGGNEGSDKPYYSRDGKGGADLERSVFRDESEAVDTTLALSEENDPTASWPFRGFDDETLDILAIISVAGACAEILSYGNAEGGVADLQQLRRIYGSAASSSKDNEDEGSNSFGKFNDDATERRLRRENNNKISGMDEREMDNRTRFALGFCIGVLRQNLGALDALAEAMSSDADISDCILALEKCPNASGYTLEGDYDKIRRERFRAEESGLGGWVERTFLGGSKTIDVEDSGVIEGKGGGERKQGFALQGDDVLYAALAVSGAFFAWASNGGLSLH